MVYVETGNASEAYRQAYNCENMKEATINRNAKMMIDDNKISTRVKELKSGHAKRHNITIDTLLEELEENRQAALGAMVVQSAAANGATMGKARLLGFLDKKEEDKSVDLVDTLNKLIDKMPN